MFIERYWLNSGLKQGLTFASLLLGLTAANIDFKQISAHAKPLPSSPTASKMAVASPGNSLLKDGTYLYGEVSQPDQLRQEYFVFEVKNNQVTGAVYMPRSEFDCFYGSLKNLNLEMKIVSSGGAEIYPYGINLQSYEPLATISANDQQMLATCQAEISTHWRAQQLP